MNNIPDTRHRKDFLRTANGSKLNQYFKNLEKLSLKGGEYLRIYQEDLDYMMNLMDNTQAGGSIFTFLFPSAADQEDDKKPCDTETYVNRIDKLTNNSYCAIATNETESCNNKCNPRIDQLEKIKHIIGKVVKLGCKQEDNRWKTAVRRYIDIIMCCQTELSQNESLRVVHIKPISKLIASNPDVNTEAYLYMSKLLTNERNKVMMSFVDEYNAFKLKYKNVSPTYSSQKRALIDEYLKKCGGDFAKIYTSILYAKFMQKYNNAKKN